jgi:hypothetical protein
MEKRLYTKGYHVKWRIENKHHLASKSEKTFVILPKINVPLVEETNNNIVINPRTKSNLINSIKHSENIPVNAVKNYKRRETMSQMVSDIKLGVKMANSIIRPLPKAAEGTEPKVHGLAVAGFVLALVGWFTPIGIAVTLLILGIIFGAIAMSKIKKNPEEYKGRGLAIAAFIVALIGFIIVISVA